MKLKRILFCFIDAFMKEDLSEVEVTISPCSLSPIQISLAIFSPLLFCKEETLQTHYKRFLDVKV